MKKIGLAVFLATFAGTSSAGCWDIPVSYNTLTRAVTAAVADDATGGFGLPSWATIVDITGVVCNVANSGVKGYKAGNSQWLGSRVISAQKANTANAFSLDGVAISSGALYAPTQPGGSLYGLQHSNPVDASRAYTANPWGYGTHWDQLKWKRIGGVNVFGGGLALYKNGKKVGAIGVSGDTSCADHANAWHIRKSLGLDQFPDGYADFEKLNLVTNNTFANLGDHAACGVSDPVGEELGFSI